MTACSALSRQLVEPQVATAPVATSWVVLEQPGPWGRRALTESHLDPVLGEALDVAAGAHTARVALTRCPGRHPNRTDVDRRRLWIAFTRPGSSWLLGGWVDDVTALGGLDWPGLEHGDATAVQRSVPGLNPDPEPLLLVCTNGRRDVCCALLGRELVAAVHDRLSGRVWETTHLGGHRFAPTAVVLPSGTTYGRLTPAGAVEVFDQAGRGRFTPGNYRGRSTFSRPAQAAEAAVRQATADEYIDSLDVVSVAAIGERWHAVVAHRDGRRWDVDVHRRALEPTRPESCGAAGVNPISFVADLPRLR